MLSRDQWIIYTALEELGFKLLSCHARVEENIEILKGYIPIIIKESIKKERDDVIDFIIKRDLITRPELFKIVGEINKRSAA